MTGQTHVVGGVASLWLLLPLMESGSPAEFGLALLPAALGSLLPDLDAAESRLKNLALLPGVRPFALPALILHRTLGHRGMMHSLVGLCLALLLLGIPLALFVSWHAGAGLVLGYASHLLLDGCTRSGIPLAFPNLTRWHLLPPPLRVVTGSPEEEVVFALLLVLALPLLFVALRMP